MEYLNVKAMNDALARFPAVLAELEAMAAELETAGYRKGREVPMLELTIARFGRIKDQLEICREKMTGDYVAGLPNREMRP